MEEFISILNYIEENNLDIYTTLQNDERTVMFVKEK